MSVYNCDFKIVIWLSSWDADDAFVCYSNAVDEAIKFFLDRFDVSYDDSIYIRLEAF